MSTESSTVRGKTWSRADIVLGKTGSLLSIYTVLYGVSYILKKTGLATFWAVSLSTVVIALITIIAINISVIFFSANDEEYRKSNYSKLANTFGNLLEKILLPVVIWI